MKALLILLLVPMTQAFAAPTPFIDSSIWSMTAPELLTPSRFVYMKDVQYVHMKNPVAHGTLTIVENGTKLIEKDINGCKRPERLNEKSFLVSGCGFATIFDLDGQQLVQKKTTVDLYEKNQVTKLGSKLFVASEPVSTVINLTDLTEKEVLCDGLPVARFLATTESKVYGQTRTNTLYEVLENGCRKVAELESTVTHIAQSGSTLAVRTSDTNVSVLDADGEVVRSIEPKYDANHPIITATSAVYPGKNGNVLVFVRSVTAKYRSGWFGGGGWQYTIWFTFYSVGPTGKIVKKMELDTDVSMVNVISTSDKNLLVIRNDDPNSFKHSTELLSGDNLKSIWKNTDAAIDRTNSWIQASSEVLVGNRGEKLSLNTGKLLSPGAVEYAQEETASVLDDKNFALWSYKSVYGGPGQWEMSYVLVNQ